MEQQLTFHIVGGTSRSRAEQARFVFARGYHAEVYTDLADLLSSPVSPGVVLAGGEALENSVASLINLLGKAGNWLPVVAASEQPDVREVVSAIEGGALDFVALPMQHREFDRLLAKLERAAGAQIAERRRVAEARAKIEALSRREREVLDLLCEGSANKVIARALDISPRTVEIHRANMMTKLDAGHAAEAIRLQFVAGLAPAPQEAAAQEALAAMAYESAPAARYRPSMLRMVPDVMPAQQAA